MARDSAISVREADPAAWDQMLRPFGDRTIFHTRTWLEILRDLFNLRIVLAQAEHEGRAIALWPLLEMRKGPLRVLGSPLPGWSTAYMGPLFLADADVRSAVQAFLDHRLFKRYAYFACRTMDQTRPVDLSPFGFAVTTRFDTYWIDVAQTEEALWGNLKSECRTRIRKAEKLGIEVRWETDTGFIDDFWAMSLETFLKSKIQPTHTREICMEMWRRLVPEKQLRAVSAFHQGARAATLVLPHDDRTMWYWGGASFQRFRELPVNNVLHWRAIVEAKGMGLTGYDMISTRGGAGRFKKSFGPRTVDICTHWERSSSRVMGWLKQRYEGYLRKRRRIEIVGVNEPGQDDQSGGE